MRLRFSRHSQDARPETERGAIIVLSAVTIAAMLGVAALVVDLSALRNDRAQNQLAVDAATAAAGNQLGTEGANVACETAFGYLEGNLDVSLTGGACSALPASCDSSSTSITVERAGDDVTARVVHPVPDGHELMTSPIVGSPPTISSDLDGDQCGRIGVQIDRQRDQFFGPASGSDGGDVRAHAVALASESDANDRPINLLILHPTDCEVITVNGSGNSGGIFVRAATDPDTGEVYPGFIAADSNGSTNCNNRGVISVVGSNATIEADGPPGCAEELAPGTGLGCGVIEVVAPGAAGCELPACSSSGVIAPGPSQLSRPLTRKLIDYRFNCKASYPDLDIPGCPDTDISLPWVDQVFAALDTTGVPPGYSDYAASYDCRIKPNDVEVVPVGNWWVDCNDLNVKGSLTFEGGNLVLAGDLTVQAGGEFRLNTANHETFDWVPGASFDPLDHGPNSAVMLIQDDGEFVKSSGADLELLNTTLFLGDDVEVDFNGATGIMNWIAPTTGPFEDLALWSESDIEHKFSGSASLAMEGVFFTPHATISYQGNGSTAQVQAQFIADKLSTGGNGSIELVPILTRMVLFPSESYSQLIR